MTMQLGDARQKMNRSLGNIVVPYLRESGFTGSFPHFRRLQSRRIDLITFQFDRYGGGFRVEFASCPPHGIVWDGKLIPPHKVRAWDVRSRQTLSGHLRETADYWFRYESGNYDRCARRVVRWLPLAETWWRRRRPSTKPSAAVTPESLVRTHRRARSLIEKALRTAKVSFAFLEPRTTAVQVRKKQGRLRLAPADG